MMAGERRLQGVAGSDGIVIGPAYLLADVDVHRGGAGGPAEQRRAREALEQAAARLGAASEHLRAAGHHDEAEILETSRLMAGDPTLLAEVETLAASRSAVAALLDATERQAALLAVLPDPYLAARAADVRRLGRQAARLALHPPAPRLPAPQPSPSGRGSLFLAPAIVVARDLGPADLAEIELAGIPVGGLALAEGSVTSHAAIVARSLGVPLVVGLGEDALTVTDGSTVVLDGVTGSLVTSPNQRTVRRTYAEAARLAQRRVRLAHDRDAGAVTADGQAIRLLVNASTEREVLTGLAAGAEGIGLLRTELAFLDAADWPTDEQHENALRPILRHLAGRPATVRTLDFGADKLPPFLRGRAERGIALQLGQPGALGAQLRALLRAGADAWLRIMLPLVADAGQLEVARRQLRAAHRAVGPAVPLPPLGAMIETRAAVEQLEAVAAVADFLSIGTNDLVQDLLGLDRLSPAATVRAAADPRVLRTIRAVTEAARRHGRRVEVCGEATGDPSIAVLLIGLGVAELSVAPSRLDEVRAAVRACTLAGAAALAERSLTLGSAEEVLALLDAEVAGCSNTPGGSAGPA
jgi:phosphoenolpyruvate-protein kinase (PTS system EI component)